MIKEPYTTHGQTEGGRKERERVSCQVGIVLVCINRGHPSEHNKHITGYQHPLAAQVAQKHMWANKCCWHVHKVAYDFVRTQFQSFNLSHTTLQYRERNHGGIGMGL